jgi:indole-3-glycerol phosphate synthase
MLNRFREAKQAEIAALRALSERGEMPRAWYGHRPPFAARLRSRGPAALIAEFKRASPSMGDLNLTLGPREAAMLFAVNGAAAMSVLTEETHFKGSLDYLGACAGEALPLLRKDFLFDPLQVVATAATPASAFLLVVRMFPEGEQLREMIQAGRDLGLEAVVEIFDKRDLELARQAGAEIIQVNARDLDTLEVDHGNVRRLISQGRPSELWIAASGVSTPEQVREAAEGGYDAVLVGTAIMTSDDPGAVVRSLAEAR